MVKSYLNVLLILFLLFSCKKITDPIGDINGTNGTWEETFTWINLIDCIHLEDDYSDCEITQTSVLRLNSNLFTVKITPSINNLLDTCDTLYSGIFWLRTDTILFKLDRDSSIQKMLYHLYDDSLEIRIAHIAFDDSFMVTPNASFLWGNARNKLSGTFYRKK